MSAEADESAWEAYLRHVRPLPGRSRPAAPAPVAPPPPLPSPPAPAAPPRRLVPPPPLVHGVAPAGLDRGSWKRLRTGRTAPARTLDLHGRSVQAAYQALERFLRAAHAEQLRCVEVITGRGANGAGAIRRELPMWLNLPALRPYVLAITHAPRGNDGATRVLIRRRP
jgi:DNA-nicking Smr family endonuclease